jgi:methionyl-tRNA formyltransferase
MKIIFMGNPQFAIPSLEVLIKSEHQVVGVATGPDKPAGRRLTLSSSPIKRHAEALGLELRQPSKLRDPVFLDWLREKNADLFVVVAFRILPPEVFELPPLGTINLHASLLPKFRGAAPINWAIIKGESKTGVTTFFIEKTVDTGNIIFQRSIKIRPEETAGELHDNLAILGSEVVAETVDAIAAGTAPRLPQQGEVTLAPKITREICEIKWDADALSIHNLVRGLSPYPGAFTTLNGRLLKIYRTQVFRTYGRNKRPGQIARIEKAAIHIQTGNGLVSILEMQPEGRRRMSAEEFLRGHILSTSDAFGT